MSSSLVQLQCPNPICLHPDNAFGQQQCERCGTPLVYRYLWAVGAQAASLTDETLASDRYRVIRPQIWLDRQPALLPSPLNGLPEQALPYLHLYNHRLHVPELYGFYTVEALSPPILLLANSPIDETGTLFPALDVAWTGATATRQVYWLWQLLQLWRPLKQQGVARSLLHPENLYVEGWRVRLRELIADHPSLETSFPSSGPERDRAAVPFSRQDTLPPSLTPLMEAPVAPSVADADISLPTLKDLADLWDRWIDAAHPQVAGGLRAISQTMQSPDETEARWQTIAEPLNHLLLEQAAQLPLTLTIAGNTSTGPQRSHNEDVCYPSFDSLPGEDRLLPHVGLICDGIGGHEGGEVASQLTLRILQPLMQALLSEFVEQPEPIDPAIVAQQLTEAVRVTNNQIAAQNNAQGRELRQRMGTTLVMLLQPPQTIPTPNGSGNPHELYIVHVGDSRAYWITSSYCHLLTVDDSVATREVCMGRSLYYEATQRSDGGALTQALGTRDADSLNITVQRFIVEESGILLLCSDGVSDNHRVEQFWQAIAQPVLRGQSSLEAAAQTWIDTANRENGHDNASVVLLHCQVSDTPQLFEWPNPEPQAIPDIMPPPPVIPSEPKELPEFATPPSELTETAKVLLYDEPTTPESHPAAATRPKSSRKSENLPLVIAGLAAFMVMVGMLGIAIWRSTDPVSFQQTWEKLLPPSSTQ